ncbi:MAG: amino acid adenylation domain-containing protein, partial [Phycisphaerae bacterium]|nr:amino acid adenylation domain-containing protein [Phycisphaerae bacterium]
YFDRSEKPILAMLACLKAGAAYVPIDPTHPIDRAAYVAAEANICLLLTEQKYHLRAADFFDGSIIAIDAGHEVAEQREDRLRARDTDATGHDLCYVLFTSGTTGRPKGIMTEHRNLIAFVDAFDEVCRLDRSDRVFQGFALGFDGSVEEIWMAFASGATLVVGTPEVAGLGPQTARLLEEQRVTFFSTVPTFLSMIPTGLPSVRTIVVSGEPCPPELVHKWVRPELRMLNVYGPTEATVNTTAWECVPGATVTIGRPLRGYVTRVLGADMKPVAAGQPGELYIGGPGIARGYLNQPELTARHFLPNPDNGSGDAPMLYRTGDLVRWNDADELEFLGRIDSQVKIRGFRVELAEIESVLRECPGIRAAVVNLVELRDQPELAAFVMTEDGDAAALDRDAVLERLRHRLPSYMVPAYLDVLKELPTLPSGKVDRKSLPAPTALLVRAGRTIIEPEAPVERNLRAVWEDVFGMSPISVGDDFFHDLGGYSLLAAQVVSELRRQFGYDIGLQEIYAYPTIRELAATLPGTPALGPPAATDAASREVSPGGPGWIPRCTTALQAALLLPIYGVAALPLVFVLLAWMRQSTGGLSLGSAIGVSLGALLLLSPFMILLSIGIKWTIIGRFRPGDHPVRGFYYLRWWLVTRFHAMSGIGVFAGTPLMTLYYRLMGARIGRRCIIDTPFFGAFDLVTIGDGSCIGSETQLLGYRVESGKLRFGSVTIGRRCFVGIHSALGLDTEMGDGARLGDLSLLPDSAVMEADQTRAGSPARTAEVPVPDTAAADAGPRRPVLLGLGHFVAIELLGLVLTAVLVPLVFVVVAAEVAGGPWLLAVAVVGLAPLGALLVGLLVPVLKRLVLRELRPGVYPVESLTFLRIWAVDALMTFSRIALRPLYTTIYLPPWLRLLGGQIGPRAEISTVSQLRPDLVDIAAESFFADGSIIGGRRFWAGRVQYGPMRIGYRSFIGNNAILPQGAALGDGCLLGVLSAPPSGSPQTPDGTEWLGSPSFRLPHRRKVGGFDDTLTFRPTRRLYALRLMIDAIRFIVPYCLGAIGLLAFVAIVSAADGWVPLWGALAAAPVAGLASALLVALGVVVFKRLLFWRYKPEIKPLWSNYVWWNEAVNGAYESAGAPALAPLLGTPWFAFYLRLLGCRIGRDVFIETTLFSEFDLVEIGDRAALNAGVVVQNHLFEDRIMKSSRLSIGDDCSVGNMAVVLYDTRMESGSSIGPLSLLMKGETLPPGTEWVGIPTRRQRAGDTDRC